MDLKDIARQLQTVARAASSSPDFVRAFPLDDIAIRSGGDGRTVEAYCAVFDVEKVVNDNQGRGYHEVLDKTSFNRTIEQRGTKFQVLFNHGMDIYMNPAPEFSKPIGVPIEVRADGRGVFTATRYSKTPLGEEMLTLVRDGAIRGQSFSGRWVRSSTEAPYRPGTRVRRMEVAMREYGPTPFPVYEEAAMTGVRSAATLADEITQMDPSERAELARLLQLGVTLDPAEDEDLGTEGKEKAPEPEQATTPEPEDEDYEARLKLLLAKAGLL